jgi:hypothetical protein
MHHVIAESKLRAPLLNHLLIRRLLRFKP